MPKTSTLILLALLFLMGLIVLPGCTPRPKPPQFQEMQEKEAASSGESAGLGTFTLQKRHGLGAWDGQPKTSEQELMRGIAGKQTHE